MVGRKTPPENHSQGRGKQETVGNILNSVPWWVYVIAAFILIGYIKKRFRKTIHTFSAEGNIRAIKKIAKSNGISCLETADASGHTPLYFASLNGHQELVELLLSYDVAVNASTIGGLTPLHGAAVGGHLDVIKLLLKNEPPWKRGIWFYSCLLYTSDAADE